MIGCAAEEGETTAEETTSAEAETKEKSGVVVNVETMTVQLAEFDDVVNVIGTVKPAEDIMVASEEGGKVKQWFIDKGAYVKAGQTIVKLNDDLLVKQLAAAKAQYNIAKVNADKSQKVFADAGAVSEVTVTTAQYNVEASRANVELLETRIEKTAIKAPVSGKIDMRLIDLGEMVAPGAPVARLLQTGTVKITAGVPERYVQGIRTGLPVVMKFDALGLDSVTGKITYVGAAISERDRTIPIEVELANQGGKYAPEMVVNMTIVKNKISGAIAVPRTAIVRIEDGYQVYVAAPAGDGYIAEARKVKLGEADKGKIVVTEGLKAGDQVIVVGQAKINPGERVTFQ